jgi:CheY-like chemotaxis protein
MAKLMSDAITLARAGTPASITLDLAKDLWFCEADAGQIGQVFHNLLLNAKQAMPQGGIIEVRARNIVLHDSIKPASGPYVRISVRDYGPGIPAEILSRIFEPYFTTKRSGSGLGLATAYAIVLKHGGYLSVDSKVGEGSEFTVLLPASEKAPRPDSPAPTLQNGTGRLLVMDDEETLRALLYRSLTTLGYEVQSACEGAEAIAMYEAAKATGRAFDAVLLDLTVSGGMGGVETAAKLKELDPSVKLIVSSGYSDAAVMSRYRDYGFDDVIPKPWLAAQVSEVFQRVLLTKAPQQST